MSRLPANVCTEHPTANLIEDSRAGDIICSECGLVIGDRVIDVTSEWRTFANDEGKDRSRVGAAQSSLLNSSDLSTTMLNPGGKQGFDISQSSLMKGGRRSGQTDTAEERYLKNGYSEISKIAERGKLVKMVVTRAKETFKKVSDKKILKGKKVQAIAGACIFIACREEGVARSFKEICGFALITKQELSKCFNRIVKNIESINTANNQGGAGDMMGRHLSQLNKSDNVLQAIAISLANKLDDLGICDGRSPLSKTAASLWMAFHVRYHKKDYTQIIPLREICRKIGVAEATVKLIYRTIADSGKIGEMVPDCYRPEMGQTPEAMLRQLL